MRIAAAVVAGTLAACGTTPAPLEGCPGAYDAIAASLDAMHRSAGRTAVQPDRPAWIATCEALALDAATLRCLQPDVATAEAKACAPLLEAVDRAPLDQPFLDTMLPKQESP